MTEYTWKVKHIEAMKHDGFDDVVVTVVFTVDGQEDSLRGSVGSDIKLAPPDAANFAALETLTETQVAEWTKAALGPEGVQRFESMVQAQIDRQKVERPKTVPLPWGPEAGDV